jgi:predicted enzyme related to lactoylglutathione lyase
VPHFLVNIDVEDLERATEFYESAFGLSVGRRFGQDGVELVGGLAPIYLLRKASGTDASPKAEQKRDYGRHWTPVHLDFLVDDLGAAVARAIGAGAKLEAPVKPGSWGDLALMSDPFGHGFCLIQFHGRGYDEIADRR